MLQAPQMATIVEKANNKLTITFMLTAFSSYMQKPCKFSCLRYVLICFTIILDDYIN